MTDSFFPNRLCGNSSLALTCPQGEEESIPLQWVRTFFVVLQPARSGPSGTRKVIMENQLSVHAVMGPWQGEAASGLMQRCRDYWEMPLCHLPDLMVATFLNQEIAESQMCEEAEFRLKNRERDDTEYFDGQLLEALASARKRSSAHRFLVATKLSQ